MADSLRSWRYKCVGARSKFWRRVPNTRLYFNGSAAKSHSITANYTGYMEDDVEMLSVNRKEYCRHSNSCTWQFFITDISLLIVELAKMYLRRIFPNKSSTESFVYCKQIIKIIGNLFLLKCSNFKETQWWKTMVILLRIKVLFLTSSSEVCFFEVHSVFSLLSRRSVNETKTEHADNEYAFRWLAVVIQIAV